MIRSGCVGPEAWCFDRSRLSDDVLAGLPLSSAREKLKDATKRAATMETSSLANWESQL